MRARLAVALSLALLAQSCTLVGLAVGVSTSREETLTPGRNEHFTADTPGLPDVGDEVEIELNSGVVLSGIYRGVLFGAFAVHTRHGLRPAPLDEVRAIRVARGTYALTGAGIGLAIDVGASLAVASAVPKRPKLKATWILVRVHQECSFHARST